MQFAYVFPKILSGALLLFTRVADLDIFLPFMVILFRVVTACMFDFQLEAVGRAGGLRVDTLCSLYTL